MPRNARSASSRSAAQGARLLCHACPWPWTWRVRLRAGKHSGWWTSVTPSPPQDAAGDSGCRCRRCADGPGGVGPVGLGSVAASGIGAAGGGRGCGRRGGSGSGWTTGSWRVGQHGDTPGRGHRALVDLLSYLEPRARRSPGPPHPPSCKISLKGSLDGRPSADAVRRHSSGSTTRSPTPIAGGAPRTTGFPRCCAVSFRSTGRRALISTPFISSYVVILPSAP